MWMHEILLEMKNDKKNVKLVQIENILYICLNLKKNKKNCSLNISIEFRLRTTRYLYQRPHNTENSLRFRAMMNELFGVMTMTDMYVKLVSMMNGCNENANNATHSNDEGKMFTEPHEKNGQRSKLENTFVCCVSIFRNCSFVSTLMWACVSVCEYKCAAIHLPHVCTVYTLGLYFPTQALIQITCAPVIKTHEQLRSFQWTAHGAYIIHECCWRMFKWFWLYISMCLARCVCVRVQCFHDRISTEYIKSFCFNPAIPPNQNSMPFVHSFFRCCIVVVACIEYLRCFRKWKSWNISLQSVYMLRSWMYIYVGCWSQCLRCASNFGLVTVNGLCLSWR